MVGVRGGEVNVLSKTILGYKFFNTFNVQILQISTSQNFGLDS